MDSIFSAIPDEWFGDFYENMLREIDPSMEMGFETMEEIALQRDGQGQGEYPVMAYPMGYVENAEHVFEAFQEFPGSYGEAERAMEIIGQISVLYEDQSAMLTEIKMMQEQVLKESIPENFQRLNDMMNNLIFQTEKEEKQLNDVHATIFLEQELLVQFEKLLTQIKVQKRQVILLVEEMKFFGSAQLEDMVVHKQFVSLEIIEQPYVQIIFKGKPMDSSYKLQLLTGLSNMHVPKSNVTAVLITDSNTNSAGVTNNVTHYDPGTRALFSNLKPTLSSRMSAVHYQFFTEIMLTGTEPIEIRSDLSLPFVVITNESQWVEASKKLLLHYIFELADRVPTYKFFNVIHEHFLLAINSKLKKGGIVRGLRFYDAEMMKVKFFGGQPFIKTNKASDFLTWMLQVERTLRFKRHILKLWNDGYIYGFLSKEKAEEALMRFPLNTFLIRFSESKAGQLGIAYVSREGIQHYLIKADDIGHNKSLPDFIRSIRSFEYILQFSPKTGQIRRTSKNQVFRSYYSKTYEYFEEEVVGYGNLPH